MLNRTPTDFTPASALKPALAGYVASNVGAEAYYRLGLACATGQGGVRDYVAAHMWFNVATLMGHEDAPLARRSIAEEMPPEDIALAQKRARAWLSRH